MAVENTPGSDHKSNELVEQLRQSLGLLRVAFDATGEAMLILDEQHHVRWVNRKAADWLGNGLALRVIGRPLEEVASFCHPDQRELPFGDHLHPLSLAQHGEGQKLLMVESLLAVDSLSSTLVQRMVSWRPIDEMASPFLLLVFRDLDPLERALHQQRSFINKLAHELRTPLAIISGNLKRLSRSGDLASVFKRSLEEVRSETRRMVGLVDKLLVLSELDTDQYQWFFEPNELHVFVDRWLDSLDPERLQFVHTNVSADCLGSFLELDQAAFCRIMNNLLDNSLRFVEGKPAFYLSGVLNHGSIELTVSDAGSLSLSEEKILSLFERFVRLEENRNPALGDGSGLGLALVQALVEGMNGTVSAGLEGDLESSQRRGIKISMSFPLSKTVSFDRGFGAEDID